jgi:hypothetical protein
MEILDEGHFLTEGEKKTYYHLLQTHGFKPQEFKLKVSEDQRPMDINDLSYVVVVKIKAIYVKDHLTRTYENVEGSGLWLTEFEEDLNAGVFKTH